MLLVVDYVVVFFAYGTMAKVYHAMVGLRF